MTSDVIDDDSKTLGRACILMDNTMVAQKVWRAARTGCMAFSI